jgi:Tfp pilus assembly protein FimT
MKTYQKDGFTIIELVVSVAFLGVITVLAAPSFAGFLERQRVATQSEVISTMLNTARSESVARLLNVDVCWNTGAAAVDVRGYSVGAGQIAVLVGNPAQSIRDVELSDDGLFIDDNDDNDCVTFLPSGRFDTVSASSGNLVFGVCKSNGDTVDSRGIVLNATGRPSTVNNDGAAVIDCT